MIKYDQMTAIPITITYATHFPGVWVFPFSKKQTYPLRLHLYTYLLRQYLSQNRTDKYIKSMSDGTDSTYSPLV